MTGIRVSSGVAPAGSRSSEGVLIPDFLAQSTAVKGYLLLAAEIVNAAAESVYG